MLKRSFAVLGLMIVGVAAGFGLAEAARLCLPRAQAAVVPPPAPKEPVAVSPTDPATAVTIAAQPQPRGDGKIGIVNLRHLWDSNRNEYWKDKLGELKSIDSEINQKIKDVEKRLRDLKEQLEGIKDRDSRLYQEKLRDAKMAEVQLELERKLGRAQFFNSYSERQLEVYNEMRRVIDVYGKDNKFDLILYADEPQLEEEDPQSVSQRIKHRVVLFHAASMDITEDVLKMLNAEYSKRKGSGKNADGGGGVCPTCNIRTLEPNCPKCKMPITKK